MSTKPTIGVTVRDFTGGAGFEKDGVIKELDDETFLKKSGAIVHLLETTNLIDHVAIVSCCDHSVTWGEAIDDQGHTPTWRAYCEHYPELVKDGRLRVVFVNNWGQNAGSGRAVQAGVESVLASGLPFAMAWSPELDISSDRLTKAMAMLEHYNLDGVGFLRQNFHLRPQWMLPQHTGLIATRECWEWAEIPTYADGDEGLTIETEVGPAKVAGMDDMARIFAAMRFNASIRIGMYGWNDPIPWNVDLDDPRQAEKIARQWAVALEWAKRSFPRVEPSATIAQFMTSMKMF